MPRRLLPLVAAALVGCSSVAGSEGAAPAPGAPSSTSSAPTTTPSPEPSPEPPPDGPATIAFAGDVHDEGRLEPRFQQPATALEPVAPLLAGADVAMVNLETAVTERGTAEVKNYTFRTPPRVFDALRAAGVDVVSMANNHAVDFGPQGLADTLAAARQKRFPVVGLGADDASAYAPWITTANGERIAVLAATQVGDETVANYSAGPGRAGVASAFDTERLVRAVRDARARAGTVVVYLHWGTEGEGCPSQRQQDLAAELAAAGADVLVGTHAHRLQGHGWLGGTYVAYGLGNFVWYSSNSPTADTTGVLTLTVGDGRVLQADFVPARIGGDGLPRALTGAEAEQVRADLAGLRDCAGLSATPS